MCVYAPVVNSREINDAKAKKLFFPEFPSSIIKEETRSKSTAQREYLNESHISEGLRNKFDLVKSGKFSSVKRWEKGRRV